MRGGAIPVLAWGTLLLALYVINWIWDATHLNPVVTALAVAIVFATGLALIVLGGKRALRTGAPGPDASPKPVPQASSGAVIAALGLASIVFGFTFGSFLVYFGAGLLVIALGRIGSERAAQRRAVDRTRAERR